MPFKKTAKGAGAGKARVEKKPGRAKAAPAKPPKAAKPSRPAAKPPSKKPKPAAAVRRPPATADELVELRHRLALAEEAASRVGSLEAEVAALERELGSAHVDRQTALDRLAALEQRLADSAEAPAPASSTAEIEQRLANALADKAASSRRVRDLEREMDSLRASLERERTAHSEARAHLASSAGAPAERSGASHAETQLAHRIAELETALNNREAELTRMLERRAGELACPRCGGKMVEFVHLGVTLDRCTECAGLFFDSGELQEVLRREYPEAEPEVEVQTEVIAVAVEVPAASDDGAHRKKGFFRTLFGRKD